MPGALAAAAVALVLARSAAASGARADAGVAAPPVPREVDLQKFDGGYGVAPAALADPDAGTPAPVALAPPELIGPSPAAYPDELREKRVGGAVELELLIGESGAVEEVVIVEGAHPLLDAAATKAARALRFKPAQMGAQAVAVRMRFTYEFEPPPAPVADAAGPRATIKGVVRARGRRTPIAGAHLETASGTATTDGDGQFALVIAAGEGAIRVTAPGFKAQTFREKVATNETVDVVYALEPVRVNPYETIVRGERERTEVSRVQLRNQELREVPGTMGDPFRVVMLMPGVGSIASGVAYPVVRGSPPSATGYFLDGISVPLLFHLFVGPAVIHPDFLEGMDFFPGSAPPRYGRLLGGVIDGKLARPREDYVRGSVYADLINAGGFIEYPIASTGTNFSVAGRMAYTAWVTSLVLNAISNNPADKVVLKFWDYQTRVEQNAAGGKLRLFVFGSSDTFGFGTSSALGGLTGSSGSSPSKTPTAGEAGAGTTPSPTASSGTSEQTQSIAFHRADLRYRHPIGDGEYELGLTFGTDRISVASSLFGSEAVDAAAVAGGSEDSSLSENTYAARVGWSTPLSDHFRLETGSDVMHRRPSVRVTLKAVTDQIDLTSSNVAATFVGAWARLIWESDDKVWSIAPGARVDNYHANDGTNFKTLEPRINVRWQLHEDFALKGAAGIYHQQPVTLITVPLLDTALLRYGLQEAAQLSTGAEWKVFRGIELTTDVYFDPMFRTLEMVPNANIEGVDTFSSSNTDPKNFRSSGYAYGLELMLRHPLGDNWFGWLAYTLQRSTRRVRYPLFDDQNNTVGYNIGYLPFAFDQTHIFNGVLGYKFASNWSVGIAVHYNTGRPEAGVGTSWTQRDNGTGIPMAAQANQVDRLPGFLRVDFRASKSWVFDLYSLELYLDVLNVTLQRETIAYDYNSFRYETTQSPPLTLPNRVKIGVPIVLPILGVKATY